MRVLHVGNMYPPHHFGGYELVWRAAVEHLDRCGHESRILTTDTRVKTTAADDPRAHRELHWHLRGARFQRLSRRAVLRMTRHNHRALSRHLSEFRPDVVAWWSMGGLTLTLLEAVRRRGVPAVAFVHDEWLDYGRDVDPWLRSFLKPRRARLAPIAERLARVPARVSFGEAAEYVFVSDFTRRQAVGTGLELPRTAVAHSGIDPDFIDPAPDGEWEWKLLYVGRLDPRKGVATVIESLPHLPQEARMTAVGGWDESEQERLEALADRLGVRDRITFAGQRDRHELPKAYDHADVVVFPVIWNEPWGLVPLEAMARGRPVVATGRGGSGEYLRDGENCLLFEAEDAQALAAAVRRLAVEPGLREQLREAGLQTAREHTEPHFNRAVERALVAAAPASPSRPANPALVG